LAASHLQICARQPNIDDMDNDLTRRAFAAYFRAGGTDQPAGTSGQVEHNGRRYVVLHNVNGTLAVYRILNNGRLKGLRRWPRAVEQW
jgi:hypothetical protein